MREVIFIKLSKRFPSVFIFSAALAVMIFSVLFPAETAEAAKDGLSLCAEKVIPSLFMFVCAARLISKSGIERLFEKCKLLLAFFGVSPAGMTVVFTGFLCGFPSGATVAAELCKSKLMTSEEACSLLPFTNCAGAAFLIGAVGSSMFGETKAGTVLFITQSVTSALLLTLSAPRRRACLACAFPPPPHKNSDAGKSCGAAGAVASAVAEGGAATVAITAFVTFFRVLTAMTAKIIKIPAVTNLFACIFEVTCGLAGLSAYYTSKPMMTIALSAAAVGFSGLSVMAQVFERASDAKIKTGGYFAGKLVLSLAMAIMSVPIYKIFYENNTKIAVILCVFLFATTIAQILREKLSKRGRKIRSYDI